MVPFSSCKTDHFFGVCLAVIHCEPLDVPLGVINSNDTFFGADVTIECVDGHRHFDGRRSSLNVNCTATRHWSQQNISCQRNVTTFFAFIMSSTVLSIVLFGYMSEPDVDCESERRRECESLKTNDTGGRKDAWRITPRTPIKRIHGNRSMSRPTPGVLTVNRQTPQVFVIRPCLPTRCAVE